MGEYHCLYAFAKRYSLYQDYRVFPDVAGSVLCKVRVFCIKFLVLGYLLCSSNTFPATPRQKRNK